MSNSSIGYNNTETQNKYFDPTLKFMVYWGMGGGFFLLYQEIDNG